jgi:protein phosphatase
LHVAALTDIGCVRTNNEDKFAYDEQASLFVVCDGMGGMAAGEVASSIACETLVSTFAGHSTTKPLELRLALSIRAANEAVFLAGQQYENRGMGTTLVAAAVSDGSLLVGNVGDSRAFLLRDGLCMQLTVDHSYLNEVLRSGRVREEELNSIDRQRFEALITRAVGVAQDVEPDFFSLDLYAGDKIVLASDGLTRYLECADIARLADDDLEASCQRMVDEAKGMGGIDNVTCLLLHVPTER